MASILLSTIGTTGDIEPYIHLTRALDARGHRVRVASHAIHSERFAGFDFVSASADFSIDELNLALDRIAALTEPIEQFERLVVDLLLRDPRAQLERYTRATDGMDLMVCHRFDYVGQEAALAAGLPWASVALMPEVYRTEEAPPFPFPRLGKWFARKAWDAADQRAAAMNRRVEERLSPLGRPRRALGIAGADSPVLNLVAASPSLVPIRKDWPPTVSVTGAWTGPSFSFDPDPELSSFLERHEPPIVVTFGSMGGGTTDETARLIAGALERVRHPAIIQSGYQGLEDLGLDRTITVGFVPHDFLFSRARCVVHHSGAGTSVASCRAGVPSVPIPHMFDQYYWAGMLHRVGVAPRPVFRRALTPKLLAQRIDEVLGSRTMSARARELATGVRAEDGVSRAVEAIEALGRRGA